MAKFLQKTAGLDKAIVGEYLGEREDQALRVMHAYVDALDFTGLEFDEAIRCAAARCVMQPCHEGSRTAIATSACRRSVSPSCTLPRNRATKPKDITQDGRGVKCESRLWLGCVGWPSVPCDTAHQCQQYELLSLNAGGIWTASGCPARRRRSTG